MYSIISTCIKERDKDSSKEEGDAFVKKVGHLGGLLSDSFCICFSVLIFFFFTFRIHAVYIYQLSMLTKWQKKCVFIYIYIYTHIIY